MTDVPLRSIVDTATDGVAIYSPVRDADGVIVDFRYEYINPVGAEIIKFRPDELLGRGLVEVSPAARSSGLFDRYVEAFEGEPFVDQVEYRSDRASGHFAIRVGEVDGHLVLRYRDVTESVELEASARSMGERLEDIVSNMSDAMVVLDRDWRFAYLNRETEEVLGRPREELLGADVWEAFPHLSGSVFETVYRRVVETGVAESFEAYYPAPLDTWYSVRAHPGKEGLTVFFQDIGPQRLMQQRLQQAQRLESIATLAGGIAHDFNNLLTVMSGHLALLREDLPADHPNRIDVDAVWDATARASDLTRQMLTFSRRQVLRPKLVDLNELVRHATPHIRRLLSDVHGLATVLHPEPVMVEVDPVEFDNGLMAVTSNAIDAMTPDGHLTLETGLAHFADPLTAVGRELEPGWYGVVSVSDDGAGMDAEVLQHAFEPFFTTKRPGHGTGLGLAVVHGMARQIGGDVTIYSEPGIGTTVRIYLPRAADDLPEPDDEPTELPWGVGGDETVLVVDDDDRVRELVERVLSDSGYRVVTASDSTTALQALERVGGTVQLVITDVIMPGGSGHDLALEVERRYGSVPVLYVSGYTENSVIRHGIPVGDVEFLAKPFAPTELASVVRRLLDTDAE
jgi:PAS domain S-box-containing protein